MVHPEKNGTRDKPQRIEKTAEDLSPLCNPTGRVGRGQQGSGAEKEIYSYLEDRSGQDLFILTIHENIHNPFLHGAGTKYRLSNSRETENETLPETVNIDVPTGRVSWKPGSKLIPAATGDY